MTRFSEMNEISDRAISFNHLVASMEPISLPELEGATLMDRVDTKYVLGHEDLYHLLQQMSNEYRVLEVGGVRISPYVTLYFDTLDRTCFLQHHNGKLNRRKFRMRQYLSNGQCFLEVKSRSNRGRTEKRRFPIARIEEIISPEAAELVRSVNPSLPELKPQLWVYFTRVTLTNRLATERITLDWGIEFGSAESTRKMSGLVIAEVKQHSDDRSSPMRKQIRSLSIRPMRISKYCLGSLLLDPKLKQNRFKPKLLAIQKLSRNGELVPS